MFDLCAMCFCTRTTGVEGADLAVAGTYALEPPADCGDDGTAGVEVDAAGGLGVDRACGPKTDFDGFEGARLVGAVVRNGFDSAVGAPAMLGGAAAGELSPNTGVEVDPTAAAALFAVWRTGAAAA
jgi:hypothetical protein